MFIETEEQYEKAVEYITSIKNSSKKQVSFDIETTDLSPYFGKILLMQFGDTNNQYCIPVKKWEHKLDPFLDILEDASICKLIQNAKFEIMWIYNKFNRIITNIYDTMGAELLIHAGRRIEASLDALQKRYCYQSESLKKNVRDQFKDHDGINFTEDQINYANEDVKYLEIIKEKQDKLLDGKYKLNEVLALEMEAVIPVALMDLNGIYIDSEKWLRLESKAKEEQKAIKTELDSLFKPYVLEKYNFENSLFHSKEVIDYSKAINYKSPPQVKAALNFFLDSPIKSTSEDVLETLDLPHAKALLKYRSTAKSVDGYGMNFLIQHTNPITKKIHSNVDQYRQATGRLAGRDPNLMNIKKEAEYREPFCVEDPVKYSMIAADYASCELRILASLSEEPSWLECFNNGYDMHSYVACLLFKLNYKEVVDENHKVKPEFKSFRDKAKAINFGVAYGMGAGKLSHDLKISIQEASDILNNFWKVFPKIHKFLEGMVSFGLENRYVTSPLDGRVRHLDMFNEDLEKDKSRIANICKNFACQAGNASITKRALCYIQKSFLEHPEWCGVIRNVVHDEIITTHLAKYDNIVLQSIKDNMINAATYYIKNVPMVVDAQLAKHWVH